VLKDVIIRNDVVIGARAVLAKVNPTGIIAIGNLMKIIGSVYA
jgi:acetyltransferase-like isoleucine patch superfamily enzyme